MGHRYGGSHKQLRKSYQRDVEAGMAVCCRCKRPIQPGAAWHLDHSDDGVTYLGPAHAKCNLRAAGKVRAAQLYGPRERPAFRYEPHDPQARAVSRQWWKQARQRGVTGPETWSRHWASDGYDGRCKDCRELGEACDAAA